MRFSSNKFFFYEVNVCVCLTVGFGCTYCYQLLSSSSQNWFSLTGCRGIAADDFLSSRNIDQFENCTVIDGNLKIVQTTFTGLVEITISIDPYKSI